MTEVPRVDATWKATLLAAMSIALFILDLGGHAHPAAGVAGGFLLSLLAVAAAYAKRSATLLPLVEVERSHPETLVEGAEVEIRLALRNKGSGEIPVLVVEDEAGGRLRPASRPWARLAIPAGDRARYEWRARPAPGYHLLESVLLSAGDPLWLFYSTRRVEARTSMRVYPLSLGEAAAGRLGRGALEARVPRRRGPGLEFYALREYVYGDDVRLIHWPSSARAGRLMVRDGPEPVEARVAVLADLSLYSWVGEPGEAPGDWIMRSTLSILSGVARAVGRAAYMVSFGEVRLVRGPSRARMLVEQARSDFSLAGPSRSSHRVSVRRQVLELVDSTPAGWPLVALLAPMAPVLEVAEAAAESGRRAWMIVYTPTSGRLAGRLAKFEERRLGRLSGELAALGARVFLASSPPAVYSAVERVVREAMGVESWP